MPQQKQTRKGTDKLKDAMRSGTKRPPVASAFMETSNNTEHVQSGDSGKSNNKNEDGEVSVKRNNKTEHKNTLNKNKNDTDKEKETVKQNIEDNNENDSFNGKSFWGIVENDKKRKTVEETHTRQTYLIRNDLLERLQKVSRKQNKGFKTKVINYALEQLLDELEG